MSTQSQIDNINAIIARSTDPAEIKQCEAKLRFIQRGTTAVTAPVPMHSASAGKVDFYAYFSKPGPSFFKNNNRLEPGASESGAAVYKLNLVTKAGKPFPSYSAPSVSAFGLPFILVRPGTQGVAVSEDLTTLTFAHESGRELRIHTQSTFAIRFVGQYSGPTSPGWYLVKGASIPNLMTGKPERDQYRNNGQLWEQLTAVSAVRWEDCPNQSMMEPFMSRMIGGVRSVIYPYPRHLVPDHAQIVALAETFGTKTKSPEEAAAEEGASTSGAGGSTSSGSNRPGIENLNKATTQLLDELMLTHGKNVVNSPLDPHHVIDFLSFKRQIMLPLQPPKAEVIIEHPEIVMEGLVTYGGPQCLTKDEVPKEIAVSASNPFGVQAVVRLGKTVFRTLPEGGAASVVVRGFCTLGVGYFSGVMGLYNEKSISILASTPVNHPSFTEEAAPPSRAALYPTVAIGPLGAYQTARENAEEHMSADGVVSSVLEFTPFNGYGSIVEGIRNGCIEITRNVAARLIRSLCVSAGVAADALPSVDGPISIAPIINKFDKDETNPFWNTNKRCRIHEQTDGYVFSPSQSITFYKRSPTGIAVPNDINTREKILPTTGEDFRFFVMANVVFTNAEQEIEYRAMVSEFYALKTSNPRKAQLAEKLASIAEAHSIEIMKAKSPDEDCATFSIHGKAPFTFELFLVSKVLDCPEFFSKLTEFAHPDFTEEALQKARAVVAAHNAKRFVATAKDSIDEDELAFLNTVESSQMPICSSSEPKQPEQPPPPVLEDDIEDVDDSSLLDTVAKRPRKELTKKKQPKVVATAASSGGTDDEEEDDLDSIATKPTKKAPRGRTTKK